VPVTPTYPGVYVEEIPSGVHTITGVATSITAFIGRASRGPVNIATLCNNFGDFESNFGGLWLSSALGFSVRDYFLNGGSQAIVVRLYHADPGNPQAVPPVNAPASKAPLTVGALKFIAANEGSWGVYLRVTVDQKGITDDVATMLGVAKTDIFNLTINDTATNRNERILNLTVKDSPRRVDNALAAESALIAYDGAVDPATAIAEGKDALGLLDATLAAAKKALSDKLTADPGADVTAEKKAVSDAKAALDEAVTKALQAVSDGLPLSTADFLPANGQANKQGMYALEQADLFNLLCIPPYRSLVDSIDVDPTLVSNAAAYCEQRRAMLLLDAPKNWTSLNTATTQFTDADNDFIGTRSANAALFFPRLRLANPLRNNQVETASAIGAIAGVFARTDTQRGVWKAPAGLSATLTGVPQLSVSLTDPENGELNPLGVNCLRAFRSAAASSGARARCAAPISWLTNTSTSRCGVLRSTSRRAFIAGSNGSCSSPTTTRCGRRYGSMSALLCTTCSAAAPFRAARRATPISSNATRKRRRRTTSISGSSTSSSASHR